MKAKFLSENDLMNRDQSTRHFYFSDNTMQFFKAQLHSDGYPIQTEKGIMYLFVDSTKFQNEPRSYQITLMVESGDTCSSHMKFNHPSEASSYLTQMLPDREKVYPSWLVWSTFRMVTKYNIKGVCDFMYIMNVTALETGVGDGYSNFTFDSPKQSKFNKVADRLIGSYGCNIPKNAQESIISELQMSLLD